MITVRLRAGVSFLAVLLALIPAAVWHRLAPDPLPV